MDNLNLIVKMIFGSHLYGTATEESDDDYKGIFMPTKEQIFLGQIPKSHSFFTKKGYETKNKPGDKDTEIYSLHYFIKLACDGQTVAMDMLHAPENMILEDSDIWREIVANREKFYTKNLNAFIGYARRQAAKYGIKGSRLAAIKLAIKSMLQKTNDIRLRDFWDDIPRGEHIKEYEVSPDGTRQIQICGKVFQETCKVGYVLPTLVRFFDEYGKRAQMAADNKGIDWKAISHALRAAFQVKQLLVEKTIIFPLKDADFLKRVKSGELDYLTVVAPKLEELMDEVEIISEKSSLPEKPDRKFWNQFIVQKVMESLND